MAKDHGSIRGGSGLSEDPRRDNAGRTGETDR